MVGEIVDGSAALWIIKRTCGELDAVVSVCSFGATTKTVYQRGEKVSKSKVQMFPAREGNTCPAQSFRIARRILTETDKANKLFIILTDGVWSPNNVNEEGRVISEDIPALVKSIPGTTVFVGIGPQGQANRQSELFDLSKGISHTNEIAPLVKQVISTMLRTKVGAR